MKNFKYLFISLFVIFAFASCEDDDKLIYDAEQAVAPVLQSPTANTAIELTQDNEDGEVAFTWSAAELGVSVAITYTVELSVDESFSTVAELIETSETSDTVTVSDINTALLLIGYETGEDDTVYCRVRTYFSDNADDLISETNSYSVTPYQTTFPPIYMVGAATGGWSWDSDVIVPGTKANYYTTLAYFTNDAFRFFAQQGWEGTSYNYPYFSKGSVSSLLEDAEDGDHNFKFIGTPGWYRISVDLSSLKVEMVAADEPLMYMTGAAVGGWDWSDNYVKMTFVQEGVWTATTDFINGEAFRFFAQQDWSPTSYNYPYFSEGSVSSLFEDAGDGDNNFRFVGTAGDYTITINLNDLTITMD